MNQIQGTGTLYIERLGEERRVTLADGTEGTVRPIGWEALGSTAGPLDFRPVVDCALDFADALGVERNRTIELTMALDRRGQKAFRRLWRWARGPSTLRGKPKCRTRAKRRL